MRGKQNHLKRQTELSDTSSDPVCAASPQGGKHLRVRPQEAARAQGAKGLATQPRRRYKTWVSAPQRPQCYRSGRANRVRVRSSGAVAQVQL